MTKGIKGVERGWQRIIPSFMRMERNTRIHAVCKRILRTDHIAVWFHEGTRNWFMGIPSRRGGEIGVSCVFPLNTDPSGEDGPIMSFQHGEDLAWNFFQAGGRERYRLIAEKAYQKDVAAVEHSHGRKQELSERRQHFGERIRSTHPYWGRRKGQRYRKIF